MKRVLWWLSMSLVLVVPLMAESVPSLPRLTPEQWKKLERGEIILTTGVKKVDGVEQGLVGAYLIFNQPVTTVWKLMQHPENQSQYLPDLAESKLVWRKGNKVDVEFMVKVLWVKMRYRVIHTYYPDRYYFNWTLDPNYDNDLKFLYGEWQLYPLKDGRTLARYMTRVHVSSMIPKFVEKKMAEKSVPENMKAFQRWINSNGHYHR